jgi:hypothetical protein
MTGATLQALAAVGRGSGGAARDAVGYLRRGQNPDGGFPQMAGGTSNAQSTAYAVQGLLAVHAGAEVVSSALRYLKRLQRRNGSVRYSRVSSQTPVWVTAQALMALRRKPLPLRPVPRKRKRRRASSATAPAAAPAPHHRRTRRAAAAAAAPTQLHRREDATAEAAPVATRRASSAKREDGGGPATLLVAAVAMAALAAIFALRFYLRRRRGLAAG